jgi:hypothetical protein
VTSPGAPIPAGTLCIVVVNPYWTTVNGRHVYTTANPAVILTRDEADDFHYRDDLQAECAAAAEAAGCVGQVACHTLGGAVVGTVMGRLAVCQ